MITKAIVEEKINQYQYRVRIPIFDRVNDSPQHTDFKDLAIATVSTPRGINNNIQVGDVVFVGFEDNNASQPIILGHLYREQLTKEDQSFLNISQINVSGHAQLPLSTRIDNLNIYDEIVSLESTIEDLKSTINELNLKINSLQQ